MNKVTLSIENGLNDHEIGAGEYIILTDAPTAANVTVKANDSFNKGWPLKPGHSLRGKKEIRKAYISADAVAGGVITLFQADSNDDFDLTTPASTVDVDNISKVLDRFRPNGTAFQETILAGASFTFIRDNESVIRFHSTDETGVELNTNGIKYPMYEDEIRIDNLDSLTFWNNTAASIIITAWVM